MWQSGRPAQEQCEGCTLFTTQIGELPYLHARDITYAALCQGPYEESLALPPNLAHGPVEIERVRQQCDQM